MERKTIMGLAAVAGIGLLLYLRRNADTAGVTAAANTLNGASYAGTWGASPAPVTTTASTKPAAVDAVATSKPPAANPAPVAAGGGSASKFVTGAGGSNGDSTSPYYYQTMGPNGVIRAGVNDPEQVGMLDTIKAYLGNGFNVHDSAQVQTLYDHARATGRSWEEANRDIAAASGYIDNDVTRVALNAGVAKW